MAKAIGFKLISINNLKAVYDHMLSEGTCCLAYGDFKDKHVKMLLEGKPELQKVRQSRPDDAEHDIIWNQLDQEIIQALIHLRTMANSDLLSLHWCQNCKTISVTAFDCDCNSKFEDCEEMVHFGIDFNDIA